MKLTRSHFELLMEFQDKSLENHLKSYEVLIDALIDLNQTLTDGLVKMDEWMVYSETLTMKFCLHGTSLLTLMKSYDFDSKRLKKKLKILDSSSILVLTRTLFENYLIFRHLYVNPNTDSRKIFLFNVWVYSSYLDRAKKRPSNRQTDQQLLRREKEDIQKYKLKIEDSVEFQKLGVKRKKTLIEKGSGRLFKQWKDIMIDSDYTGVLNIPEYYSYLSSFAHSEGLSAAKVRNAFLSNPSENQEEVIIACSMVKILIGQLIMNLVHMHKIVEIKFATYPQDLIDKIQIYSNVGAKA